MYLAAATTTHHSLSLHEKLGSPLSGFIFSQSLMGYEVLMKTGREVLMILATGHALNWWGFMAHVRSVALLRERKDLC